jgi:hypothetical protein
VEAAEVSRYHLGRVAICDRAMSVLESLEQSGEALSPAVRAALVLLEGQAARAQERIQLLETQVRVLSGEERVDDIVEYRPEIWRGCGLSLADAPPASEPGGWQVIKLPPVRARITELSNALLRLPHLRHPHSGNCSRVRAEEPLRNPAGGVRCPTHQPFAALAAAASGVLDLLNVPAPSLGSTQAFREETSAALLSSLPGDPKGGANERLGRGRRGGLEPARPLPLGVGGGDEGGYPPPHRPQSHP